MFLIGVENKITQQNTLKQQTWTCRSTFSGEIPATSNSRFKSHRLFTITSSF